MNNIPLFVEMSDSDEQRTNEEEEEQEEHDDKGVDEEDEQYEGTEEEEEEEEKERPRNGAIPQSHSDEDAQSDADRDTEERSDERSRERSDTEGSERDTNESGNEKEHSEDETDEREAATPQNTQPTRAIQPPSTAPPTIRDTKSEAEPVTAAPGGSASTGPEGPKERDKFKMLKENEEKTPKMSLLMTALMESEQIGPAIKAVFESGKERAIVREIAQYMEDKEHEIEDICNFHYREFISSVDELLVVRQDAHSIKEATVRLNNEIQRSGRDLLRLSKNLVDLKHVRRNIRLAVATLEECQIFLGLFAKVKEHISARKFYHALRLLEQISTVMPTVRHYEFAQYLEAKVPLLKKEIQRRVTSEFNDWLEKLRDKSEAIGELATAQMLAQLRTEDELTFGRKLIEALNNTTTATDSSDRSGNNAASASATNSNTAAGAKKPSKRRRANTVAANRTNRSDAGVNDYGVFERVKVDFAPLYQCLHIYDALGNLKEFQEYYQYNRKLQVSLILQSAAAGSFLRDFNGARATFHQLAGFFITEYAVIQTTDRMLEARSTADSLWETVLAKLRALVQEQVLYCPSSDTILNIKSFILLFARTLEQFGYAVQPFKELIMDSMKSQFAKTLFESATAAIRNALQSDDGKPLRVTNAADYATLIVAHGFDAPLPTPQPATSSSGTSAASARLRSAERGFPVEGKSYPFSIGLCRLCEVVEGYIRDYRAFAAYLGDLDDVLKKATTDLLERMGVEIKSYAQQLASSAGGVGPLVQLAVNMPFLIGRIVHFEEYLSQNSYNGGSIKLPVRGHLEDAFQVVNTQILNVVVAKVDTYFAAAESTITWTPSTAAFGPREYAGELVSYLRSMYAMLEPLGAQRDDMIYKAYKHATELFMGMVCKDNVKKINYNAVVNLERDFRLLEAEGEKTGIGLLKEAFREFRQLLNLLLAENIEEFNDLGIRNTQYHRLKDYPRLISILEKYKDDPRFKKSKKKTGNNIGAVIKKLKELMSAAKAAAKG